MQPICSRGKRINDVRDENGFLYETHVYTKTKKKSRMIGREKERREGLMGMYFEKTSIGDVVYR